MRLHRRSSRGVQPSFTVFPESPRLGSLDTEAPLMGFLSPSAHMGEESPRPRRLPGSAPRFCRGMCRRVPPRRLRCRSQVFSTSQRLLPLFTVPPFSGGWRSWGSPFRGLILPRSPDDSSPPDYPHDVSPAGRAPPILGRGIRRRDGRRLGCSGRLLDRLQGFPPRVSRSASPLHFHDAKTDLPLLGFHLLMVCTPVTGGGSRPSTVELHEQEAVACPLPAALHGLPNHPSRSSLTRGPSHHEVLRLRPAPPFGV